MIVGVPVMVAALPHCLFGIYKMKGHRTQVIAYLAVLSLLLVLSDEYLLSGPENDNDLFRDITGVFLYGWWWRCEDITGDVWLLLGGLAYECIDALKFCEALQSWK